MSMKAVAIAANGTEDVLQIVQVAIPIVTDLDVLIKVHAFALNPVDAKIRRGDGPSSAPLHDLKILGWDGSGVVESVGSGVKDFKAGEEVYFSGSIARNGSYAEYVVVDHRVLAHKPKSVSHEVAASMPLTALTAWEAIEEKFNLRIPAPGSADEKKNASKSLLVVAGAGGVGSIAIQLAKRVFKVGKVVATAGRAESATWCRNQGADVILDRTKDWKTQLTENGIDGLDYILSCTEVDDILDTLVSLVHPWSHICGIVINHKPLNIAQLFRKCLSFSWEFMGSRPIHHYQLERHGEILTQLASFVEAGTVTSWVGTTYDKVTIENMRAGHILQESGTAIGKITYTAKFD